jgi:glucose-1-phosphate cytidylyltransferase
MKVVILAGGLGTRILEESGRIPKPMVPIGDFPIIWHLMKTYAHHGFKEFIICLGYKGYAIKEYFSNYYLHNCDLTVKLQTGDVEYFNSRADDWTVTLVDTGLGTQTGGRLKRIAHLLGPDDTFLLTYGDGLCDVDMRAELEFHRRHGKQGTILAVRPSGRFGALEVDGEDQVQRFIEKPRGDGGYINGGFFILNREVVERIEGDATVFEQEPLEGLARDGELAAFRHDGFWHCMDTLKDSQTLNAMWDAGDAGWAVWTRPEPKQVRYAR